MILTNDVWDVLLPYTNITNGEHDGEILLGWEEVCSSRQGVRYGVVHRIIIQPNCQSGAGFFSRDANQIKTSTFLVSQIVDYHHQQSSEQRIRMLSTPGISNIPPV